MHLIIHHRGKAPRITSHHALFLLTSPKNVLYGGTVLSGSPSSPVQKTHQQHVREICSALEAHSEREPGPHKLILHRR